ncbi:MAG TPA: YciI family protein [Kofleriaceae bacterium]|nr:YciI family protein [Kofleriaceae bacterium]
MRFMMMHKVDAAMESGALPSPEVMERMGVFMGESAGQLLGGEGLQPSKTRTRLTFVGGEVTATSGPYTGHNELPARVALIKVKTREEAVDWAFRYGKVLGDGELELGPVTEAWDLGFMPKPDDAPLRFLLIHKADAGHEAGTPPTARQKAGMTRLIDEMTTADVLISVVNLQPSAKSTRIKLDGTRRTVIDGPFAETKELIAGYGLLELPSKEAAIESASKFAAVFGPDVAMEIDIRPLGDDPYVE